MQLYGKGCECKGKTLLNKFADTRHSNVNAGVLHFLAILPRLFEYSGMLCS